MATPLVAGTKAGLETRRAGGGFGSILKTAGSAFFKATPIGQKFEKLKLEAERIRELQSRTELFEEQGVREEARLDIAEAGEARDVAKQEKLDAPVGMKQLLTGFGVEAQKNIRNFLERRDLIDDDTDSIRREDADEMLKLLRTTPSLQSELNRAVLKDFDSGIAPLEAQLQEVITKAIEKTGLSKAELMANPGLDTSGKLEKVLNQIRPLERDRGFVLADIKKGKGQQQRTQTKLDVTRSVEFDRDLSGVQTELSGATTLEDKRELVLKLIDFYKGQRNEIIQQLRLSHPDVMESLGFGTGRDVGGRSPD